MKNLELLKRIIFLADRFQKYDTLDFTSINIKVNTLLENSELVMYVFNVLQIPFESFTPSQEDISLPDEINFYVGTKVDLKIIFYFTFVAKEIFNDRLNIYINYATEPEGMECKVFFGSYITNDRNFTNVSRPIKPNEIAVLDIENLNWEHFSGLFPNENYSDSGTSISTSEGNCENDDNYDDRDYDNNDSYVMGDPRYDRNENPWIDVYGEGDESETAYWNTD